MHRERSHQDIRKVHVYLIDSGIETLQAARTPLEEHFTRQFGDLQNREQTMIIASLQSVAQMMGAQHIDAAPVLDIGIIDRQGAVPENTELFPSSEEQS